MLNLKIEPMPSCSMFGREKEKKNLSITVSLSNRGWTVCQTSWACELACVQCVGYFYVSLTHAKVIWEEETQLGKFIQKIQLEDISDWWWTAQPIIGGTIPELVALVSVKRQAEQAMGSEPVSSSPHGLCISSCWWTWVPAVSVPVLTSISVEAQAK